MKAVTNGSRWPFRKSELRGRIPTAEMPFAEVELERSQGTGASSGGALRQIHLGLPMPSLEAPTVADDHCDVTSVDRSGRLGSRSFLTFVGWSAGQPVTWTVVPGPAVVVVSGGEGRLDQRGYLVLPLGLRRRCRIVSGDRVLVVADRARASLLVIPTALVPHLLSAALSDD